MATYPTLGLSFAKCLFAALVLTVQFSSANAQTSDFEQRRTSAYQKFHRGEVRASASDIRILADQANDEQTKALLLRDLTEVCAAAAEVDCAMRAQEEAFGLASKSDVLKSTIAPELYYYFIKGLAWMGNKQTLGDIFKEDRLHFYHPTVNPAAAALAHLMASTYFVTADKYHAAESEYSVGVLCLLLVDPQNRYAISKILIGMLEALIVQQDIVGALRLIRLADGYLTVNLSHDGPYWAQYAYLATDLLAITKRHTSVVPALVEVTRLTNRLDINEGVKLYRTGTGNNLQTLILLFDGKDKEAIETHSRHPLHARRDLIVQRGYFENLQEFYFAVADVIIENILGARKENDWKASFLTELPKSWQLTQFQQRNFDSYRKFALGVIESNKSKVDAGKLLRAGASQRINLFEEVLKQKFEGFQLPTIMDALVVRAGLAAIADNPEGQDHDLMLRGSEVLLRSVRHQLSDFSILIGAQGTERARASARSYHLLQQQKRDWEFRQIEDLLNAKPDRNLGAITNTYSQLVSSISELKDRFSNNREYKETVGYPDVKQVQHTLGSEERFVTYVPTFKGIGRLCIERDRVFSSFSNIEDRQQFELDLKLVKLALTADHAADANLDSQFPAPSAVRLQRLLFEGLGECLPKGVHINIAVPDELLGIPLAALLTEMPQKMGEGYDLQAAKWLGNDFSFSMFVSARHFLGTFKSLVREETSQSYLGIGNPKLSNAKSITTSVIETAGMVSLKATALLNLTDLPQTADELKVAKAQFPTGELLLGSDASEENFRSRDLGKYDIIHFATHGLLGGELDGLTEPALVLTPTDFDDSFDDGLLTASEITRFSLNARLIVLSACNTAKVDVGAATLGASDLQAAFSVAGAPTLLATLWPVETNTARDIAVRFFAHWQEQPDKSASLALAAATQSYLKTADRAHQHPRFWAPFVVLGYGYKIGSRPTNRALPLGDFQTLDKGAGEIIDVKTFQNGLIASMHGDWNGQKMASIVKNPYQSIPQGVKTYEVGAGHLVSVGEFLYVVGYRSSEKSFPILRKITKAGLVAWEKNFEDLENYTFSDTRYADGSLIALAEPPNGEDRRIIIMKLDLEGKEVARTEISAPPVNLLTGRRTMLGSFGNDLLVVANSQTKPGLVTNSPKSNPLGMGSWCEGTGLATIYLLDVRSLTFKRLASIEMYQATKVESIGLRIIIGGAARDFCSNVISAILYEVSHDGSTKKIWSDDDPFSSAVQSFENTKEGFVLLIRRERPVGIRVMTAKSPELVSESKRWGDDGVELWEFSVVAINPNGKFIWQYDSSFGLSVFIQGLMHWQADLVLFGSLGGRPAISRQRLN